MASARQSKVVDNTPTRYL